MAYSWIVCLLWASIALTWIKSYGSILQSIEMLIMLDIVRIVEHSL